MEFWGAEVKSGEPFLVNPGEGKILHLSQACLGEVKKDKGKESVLLHLNVDGHKLVLGTLNSDKFPQQLFDLVFDRNFELSHTWKNGSVYFYGYKAFNHDDQSDEDDSESDSEEDEEDIPLLVANNGKQEKPTTVENPSAVKESGLGKKVKIVEPKKDVKAEDEEDSSDDSDAMSEDDSDSEEDGEGSSDDEDEDEDSDEDEETPKKAEPSKKRPSESATKTPVPSKKTKVVTPQKTDGKKGGVHVATPHPAKKAGKTPATAATATTSNKANQQSPKSEGSHSCNTCKRSFKSDGALDSHNKAKHSSGK